MLSGYTPPPPPPKPGPRTLRIRIGGEDNSQYFLAWDQDTDGLLIECDWWYAFDGCGDAGVWRWAATQRPEDMPDDAWAKLQPLLEDFRRDPRTLLDRANAQGDVR